MPRRPRLKLAAIPLHLIQWGNNRGACFFAEDDYQFCLDHLGGSCKQYAVDLHAYVLMTNHVHLLMTPQEGAGPSRVMKHLGQRYVQYVNRTYRRSGTLWQGRFRSCLVGEEDYFLGCHRYIELNPVRAGMVVHPGEYRWSSYGHNAQGGETACIRPHPLYTGLGRDTRLHQEAYRELFRYHSTQGWWTRYVRQLMEVMFWGRSAFRRRSLQCWAGAPGGAGRGVL